MKHKADVKTEGKRKWRKGYINLKNEINNGKEGQIEENNYELKKAARKGNNKHIHRGN
jgi:hypothetical protein